MNCRELRSDIEKLRNEQQKLWGLMDDVQSKSAVRAAGEKVDLLADDVLEKYMEDFFEKNPEITRRSPKSLERFRCVHEDGEKFIVDIKSIAPTIDGGMLVGGNDGAMCEYRKEGGEWKVIPLERFGYMNDGGRKRSCSVRYISPTLDGGLLAGGWSGAMCEYRKKGNEWKMRPLERFKYVDEKGDKNYYPINAIAPTRDGGMLAGGWFGAICEYKKEGNEWKMRPLERLKYVDEKGKKEDCKTIMSIAPTPDGGVLVGGDVGVICEYRKEGGEWKIEQLERLKYMDEDGKGFPTLVRFIAPIPDGGMLVGGDSGVICEYRKEGGEWKVKPLEKFKYADENGNEFARSVSFIAPTLDGGVLVGGDRGAICEYRKEGDEWKMTPLESFKHIDEDGNERGSNICAIAPTLDGGMLVGGPDGVLSEYIKPPRTLETLKEHLAEIAEKKEV